MRKPLTGTILGILIGIALAVILARQGVWPLDQLTLFFIPAITGVIGLLLLSIRRASSGTFTLVIALLILVPMLIWGALGFAVINQNGELNGGCRVFAASDVDQTDVLDTSRRDPFVIDPDGGLAWEADSPTVFQDYEWEINVVLGGIPVTIDSDTEANSAGDQDNDGDVADIRAYASDRGIDIDQLVGVYQVSGSAATCDGFGFVQILGDGLDLITLIAIISLITFLVILIVLMFVGRGGATAASAASGGGQVLDVEDTLDHYEAHPKPETDQGSEFIDDLGYAADESDLGTDDAKG
ncbi:MAG: hypothetical protein PVF87_04500 [Acidimicrobiia bacterium]|jgi:hypothetical protein